MKPRNLLTKKLKKYFSCIRTPADPSFCRKFCDNGSNKSTRIHARIITEKGKIGNAIFPFLSKSLPNLTTGSYVVGKQHGNGFSVVGGQNHALAFYPAQGGGF